MKRTENIRKEQTHWITRYAILTLGIVMLLCLPAMTQTSHAQGHSSHYFGMAYLAEQEIKTNELQAQVKEDKRIETAANVVVKDDENKSVKLETEDDK